MIPAQCGWTKWSSGVILVENPLSGELILSDFDQSEVTMASADIALEYGLNFQVEFQDRLRMKSDAYEALA